MTTKQLLREIRRMAKSLGAVVVIDRKKMKRFDRAYGRKQP